MPGAGSVRGEKRFFVRRGRAIPQATQSGARLNEVELHIGHQVRLRRMLLSMTQAALASKISVKRQQLQNDEHGANSFGAATLYTLAVVLGVPVARFFEGLLLGNGTYDISHVPVLQGRDLSADALPGKGIVELAVEEVFHAGAAARTRKGIFDLVRAFQWVKVPEQRRIILEEAKRLAECKE